MSSIKPSLKAEGEHWTEQGCREKDAFVTKKNGKNLLIFAACGKNIKGGFKLHYGCPKVNPGYNFGRDIVNKVKLNKKNQKKSTIKRFMNIKFLTFVEIDCFKGSGRLGTSGCDWAVDPPKHQTLILFLNPDQKGAKKVTQKLPVRVFSSLIFFSVPHKYRNTQKIADEGESEVFPLNL